MNLEEGEGNITWEKKHQIALCGEFALEESQDLRKVGCGNECHGNKREEIDWIKLAKDGDKL